MINELKIHDAIEKIMAHVRSINKYLEVKSPWKRIKDPDGLPDDRTTMFVSANALFVSAQLLEPIMPNRIRDVNEIFSKVQTQFRDITFGQIEAGDTIEDSKVLFPRIDK